MNEPHSKTSFSVGYNLSSDVKHYKVNPLMGTGNYSAH